MRALYARSRRVAPEPTLDREARLSRGASIVAIGGLSLLSWAVVISIALALWSSF